MTQALKALEELQEMWDFIDRQKIAHPKMMRDWAAALTVVEDALAQQAQDVTESTMAMADNSAAPRGRVLPVAPALAQQEAQAEPEGELPGMWERADFTGGATDTPAPREAQAEPQPNTKG